MRHSSPTGRHSSPRRSRRCPQLYRAANLVERGGTVAEEGFDWDALDSWRDGNRLRFLYQLDDDQVEGAGLVVGACHAVIGRGRRGARRR